MSAVALLAKHGLLPFGEYKDGAKNLHTLENSEEIQSLITYYDALRYKDAYMANMVDGMNFKSSENADRIVKEMEKHGMLLLSYTIKSGAPHTVLAYKIETGSFNSDGFTYPNKLYIYDPVKDDEAYILFTNSGAFRLDKENINISFIQGDAALINDGGYLAGTRKDSEYDYAFVECEKIDTMNYEINLNGKMEFMNNVPCFFAPDANSNGYVKQTDAGDLDAMIRYSDWLVRASAKDFATISFDKTACSVSVSADAAAPYTLSMTLGDNCPMTWFTLQISGASAKKATLTAVENGYILESDENLSGITAEAFGKDSSAKISFSCEYKKVLIYQTDDNKLGVKADADGDGIYETDITLTQKLLGDVNEDGKIDSVDAAEILVAAASKGAGGEGLSEQLAPIADVNSNGDYDATDAAFILQFAAYAGAGGKDSLPEFINSIS